MHAFGDYIGHLENCALATFQRGAQYIYGEHPAANWASRSAASAIAITHKYKTPLN